MPSMENPLLTHPVPPLLLSAARRLLDAMTVDLDSSTFSASGEIGAFLRLKAGETEASLTLRSGPTGLLASCSLCRTEGELPCTHAIAVLLVFRERSSSRETRKTSGRTPPLPLRHPAKTEESLQDFPCTTLLLSGTREAPFFVALTRRMTPMDHARFHLLESGKKGSGKDLSPPAELFSGAFAPHLAKGRDGSLIPGYRPRSGGRDALFRYLSLPGIRILSARTKSPYRIECPPTPPSVRIVARWKDRPGEEVVLEGSVEIARADRSLRDVLWMSFEGVSILAGGGSLLFFARDSSRTSLNGRLLERAGDPRPLPLSEWAPLFDPGKAEEGPGLLAFDPPDLAPRFGSRSRWTPVLRLAGRPGGGLLLTPEISYPDKASIPLFGPDRHRLGDHIPGGDLSGDSVPFLIGRDREKELIARNHFEKVARLSSADATIPVDPGQAGDILDRVVPELEAKGFRIDRSALHEGSILPGPVTISLGIRDLSPQEVSLSASVSTGAGIFPLPGRPPDENSSLLHLPSGSSVYLEGAIRDHDREICRLFTLDGEGSGQASRYYVSMIMRLRPDLPLEPAPGVRLEPFSPSPLEDQVFGRLSRLFSATLRPYQREAVSTLVSLRREGLSGILADEMGLGKTISILAFLSWIRQEAEDCPNADRPPLVALPASLLYNWSHEAGRFCPTLRTYIHAGMNRQARLPEMEKADIILTTYGTLRNDPHLSEGPPFSCLVLDEAHMVKNPDSLTHQALLSLPARQKIAVTGTPVENRLFDLWGIMNLLTPGLLGSKLQFERRFLRETGPGGEQERKVDLLRNLVAPLVLRRTKEMVLTDLPPKVEMDVWIDPSPEEKAQYTSLRKHGRQEILLSEGSPHMATLTLLLRLRQFACHPALLPPDLQGGVTASSKFDLVCAKIEEGVSEGHKILLFSQFTKVLDLFDAALPAMGISSVRLDGSTPLEERKRRVEAFQSEGRDSPMVFLASLKAGGVGLTLTQADYVFHYDPWWNPQVESQASDRSHRIGQKKSVFVYRFLVRETVEERVRTLKESKKDLFDRIMDFGGEGAGDDPLSGRISLAEMQSLLDDEAASAP